VLAVVCFAGAAIWVGLAHDGIDRLGKPLGTDFVSFWTASQPALGGQPAAAYDASAHAAAQRALFSSASGNYYAFFYPPVFLLLCLPLAMLPYGAALIAWLAGGFLVLVSCLRRLLPQRWAVLPIVAFPALLVNAGHGQNGFLSAACFGGGLLMQRWPVLAGVCLGGLAFKPHLALAMPIALIAAQRWSALAAAMAMGIGLSALSWLVLGEDAWRGFFDAAPLARATLESGLVDPAKMQSLFAAIRLIHGSLRAAYAAMTLASLVLLARATARHPGARTEGALLVAASLLATPFLLDYDLVCLSLVLAWVAAAAQETGWRPWEKVILLAAYVLPLVSRPAAMAAGIPLGPPVLFCLLLVVIRRAAAPAEPRPMRISASPSTA
jgi:hypothetical protein